MLIFNPCASENVGRLVTPAKKLEDTIRLSELVIEVLQQNEEHHAEVSELLSIFTFIFQLLICVMPVRTIIINNEDV